MQSTNFVALTGHLNEYPLAELFGILRHRRKTGRLLIEYTLSPCSFYFVEGQLVDAQLNTLNGLQAVLVALSQPNAAFNFNPLIEPPRRSISESSQKVILELLGCWDEKTIETEAETLNRSGNTNSNTNANGRSLNAESSSALAQTGPIKVNTVQEGLRASRELSTRELLALPPSSTEREGVPRLRQVLIASAVISLLVSFVTVGILSRWVVKRDLATALTEMARNQDEAGKDGGGAPNAQALKVRVQVLKGRVASALIEDHQAGMEKYEALALRIARERRYAATATGQDTVVVKISPPQ